MVFEMKAVFILTLNPLLINRIALPRIFSRKTMDETYFFEFCIFTKLFHRILLATND